MRYYRPSPDDHLHFHTHRLPHIDPTRSARPRSGSRTPASGSSALLSGLEEQKETQRVDWKPHLSWLVWAVLPRQRSGWQMPPRWILMRHLAGLRGGHGCRSAPETLRAEVNSQKGNQLRAFHRALARVLICKATFKIMLQSARGTLQLLASLN